MLWMIELWEVGNYVLDLSSCLRGIYVHIVDSSLKIGFGQMAYNYYRDFYTIGKVLIQIELTDHCSWVICSPKGT